jgi:tRNA-dihydrouridine synthase A
LLYTEMVNVGGILFGGTERHLRYNAEEHPVALQLGGNEPGKLAQAHAWANSGVTTRSTSTAAASDRVQRGAFGASLMKAPSLVADCVKAMVDGGGTVTVKHRIGLDKDESYASCATSSAPCRTPVARCSSCMRAMPGCKASHPKTATSRRCAAKWRTG